MIQGYNLQIEEVDKKVEQIKFEASQIAPESYEEIQCEINEAEEEYEEQRKVTDVVYTEMFDFKELHRATLDEFGYVQNEHNIQMKTLELERD